MTLPPLLTDWPSSLRVQRWGTCLFVSAVQGFLLIAFQLYMTGALSAPLDDTLIHYQYAKQIAQGQYFQYQTGVTATSGATSFLYAHLIAVGFLLRVDGSLIILWSHFIAWISAAAVLYLLIRLGEELYHPQTGWGAALLVLCSGYLAWAFWSGMEIALFAALILTAYLELLKPNRSLAKLFMALGFLALCRPEGQILSVLILGLLIGEALWSQKTYYSSLPLWRTFLSSLFMVGSLILPNILFWWLTGNPQSNGLRAKSLFLSPILTEPQQWEAIRQNAQSIALFFLGDPSVSPNLGEFVLPGLLLFSTLGLAGLAYTQGRAGLLTALFFLIPVGGALAGIATLEVWSLHSFRYLAPFVPLAILIALIGLETTLAFWRIFDPIPGRVVVVVSAVFLLTYFPVWTNRYAEQSTTIYYKQMQAAQWTAAHLPDGHPLAVNDAGALAYYGRHELYDLVGLVTNETTIAYRMGEGALYEEMEWLPENRRPVYAAVFPSWFEEMAQIYDVFHDPLATFPDPFDPGFGKTVYRFNWSYAGMENSPRQGTLQPGWVVKDAVDIADIRSEQKSNYKQELRNDRYPEILIPFRRNFGYHEEIDRHWPDIENEQEYLIPQLKAQGILNQYDIVDAGRRIENSESFTLSELAPKKEAHLILRTCDNSATPPRFFYQMSVFVDGVFAGNWRAEGTPWNWYETVFTIPAEMIQDSSVRIQIQNQGSQRFSYYDSYFYWICQSES